MHIQHTADAVRFPGMTTAELRSSFLLSGLAQPGEVSLAYVDVDRAIAGFAIPLQQPLDLPTDPALRADFFLQRRELGVLNIGGKGTVTVDGVAFEVSRLDTVYVARGSRSVAFSSADPTDSAVFYLLSYPAHAVYPSARQAFAELTPVQLGSVETCNRRLLYRAIHENGLKSCQLVMGYTVLQSGSNWNTMPPHTHDRRSEIYMYFDLPEGHRVFHMMGQPSETRHLVMADRDIVVSPGWSIHAGVGTSNYAFCWGMGGENQAYDDMDPAPIPVLR